MSLLATHLEQILLSTKSIAELEFPPPKIFTNALLKDHEITTLIRDTEPHERALFTLDESAVNRHRQQATSRSGLFLQAGKTTPPAAHPSKQSTVTRLLGSDMLQEIRHATNRQGGVNVEVLLRGAERLCSVYTVAGAAEKIRALRSRYQDVAPAISALEEKVSKQQAVLARRNKGGEYEDEEFENVVDAEPTNNGVAIAFTEQDFQHEEAEIRELEARKKSLEDRVSGIERDLGGLLH
ncbi:DASH complex subunit Spc34 [Exophiala viscosa]|uniref:DASH complex subunit Spc34 n=1 Tax=Exophiala viscosa TaxID=2486360 RepID=UPI0021928C3E|nr:DASH complex subunit Spc34 [Exophiala viscosa]